MKKLKFLGLLLIISALVLGACGKNNDNANNDDGKKDDPALTTEKETEGGSIESGQGYGFTDFELEIDVDNEDAIDVSYDVTKKADSEYDNKLEDINLEGAKAMDEIHLMFQEVRITKDTPEDQVIQEILQYYGLDSYSKFDLDVEFDEGTTLNINQTQ